MNIYEKFLKTMNYKTAKDIPVVYSPVAINEKLIADGYVRKHEFQYKRLDLFPDMTGQSILDLGCNTGSILIELKKRGAAECLGIEGNDEMLRIFEFVVDNTQPPIYQIKAYNLDIYSLKQDKHFDNVLFMAIENKATILRKLNRIIACGKRFFIEPVIKKSGCDERFSTAPVLEDNNDPKLLDEFICELKNYGDVKILGFTDLYDRPLIQLDTV